MIFIQVPSTECVFVFEMKLVEYDIVILVLTYHYCRHYFKLFSPKIGVGYG